MGQTAAPAAPNDAPVLLRYHFHTNEVRNITMTMVQKIQMSIQGQDLTQEQTLGMGYSMKVLSVDDKGNAEVKVTFRSMLLKQAGPSGNLEYDSAHPPATVPPVAAGFAALVGQGFTIKFAPDGEALNLSGVDEMQDKVIAQVPAELKATMEKPLKEQFGNQAMKEMMEQMTRIYSDKAVKTGDTWSQHVELTKGFPLIMDNKYTLTGRSSGISTVSVKSECKPNPKAGPLDLGLVKLSYELSGTQEGKMEIEEETGWTRTSKWKQSLTGTMTMDSPQSPQPLSVPVTIDGTVTMTTEPEKR